MTTGRNEGFILARDRILFVQSHKIVLNEYAILTASIMLTIDACGYGRKPRFCSTRALT
jgi:hypothetical protein